MALCGVVRVNPGAPLLSAGARRHSLLLEIKTAAETVSAAGGLAKFYFRPTR